jgi:glycosyltransferase involved in cell wall biosynthesis
MLPSKRPRSQQDIDRDRATESCLAPVPVRPVRPPPSAVWRAKPAPQAQARSKPSTKPPAVSVVIPTLNEARNLEHVLPALPEALHEVILVDGGSSDDTLEVAERLLPSIRITRQTRSGKGNALACGFAACSGDIIVMLDADGSADPDEIMRFVDALVDGADFAKGSRFLADGGSADITRIRSLGNRCLGLLVNLVFRSAYTDLCYGYNAFWAATCLPVLELEWTAPSPEDGDGRLWGDGFEIETLINIRVAEAGLNVVEVPSFELSRRHGVSNLNAPRDGLRVLRTIITEYRSARARRRLRRFESHSQPMPVAARKRAVGPT